MSWAIFLVTVVFIVLIHEWGHYRVACSFNVAVKTFSIGFGKGIYSWHSKKTGAEFRLSPILLGGYVQFCEENVDGHILFKDLAAGKKILILLAGPLANLLFGLLLLFVLFWVPSYQPVALFQEDNKQTVYQLKAVNQQVIQTWTDAWDIIKKSKKNIVFKLDNLETRVFSLKKKPANLEDFLTSFHLSKKFPNLKPIVGKVYPNSLAEKIGLQSGDKILAVNSEMIDSINRLIVLNQELGEMGYHLSWVHQGQQRQAFISPHKVKGRIIALGIASQTFANYPNLFVWQKLPISEAFFKSLQAFGWMVRQQSRGLFHLIEDKEQISGPIGIGISAQQAWYTGISTYLLFVIWINISIGLLNLLPLPILDGGQCLIILLNALFPSWFSEHLKKWLLIISLIVLFVLFFVGMSNDWSLLQN